MPVLRTGFFLASVLLSVPGIALAQDVDSRDLSVQQQMVAAVAAPASDLRLTAWVDHENNSYKLGEAIQLFARVNEDAYITVVSIGPSGSAVLLYPNEFQPAQKVKGGTIVQIPGTDAAAQIIATAPAGNELIRVIASSEPLEIVDNRLLEGTGAFRSIKGGADQVAKDLALAVAAEPEIAFYNKVIKTKATGNAEIAIEVESEDEDAAPFDGPAPLIATNALSYAIGDSVQLAVTAMQDCNLWVVNVSSDRSVHLLFPNNLVRNNGVDAGETVLVSGGSSPVDVKVAGPAGKEAIYALCSEEVTPPWQAGIDFAQLFPELDDSEGLGKALVAIDAEEEDDLSEIIPDIYAWSVTTLTVTD